METRLRNMQSALEKGIVLHEHEETQYTKQSFSVFIRNKRKLEYNSKGKPGLSTKELAGRIGVSLEMLRKIINKQKPNQSRDCIIAICAALKLDVDDANEALRIYQYMPKLDEESPRDKLIIEVLNGAFDQDMSIGAINARLQQYSYPSLDIVKSRPRNGIRSCLVYQNTSPFKVTMRSVKSLSDEVFFGDPYDSLSSAYSFSRFKCIATMQLDDIISKKQYILTSEPEGKYKLEILPSHDAPDMQFHSFTSLDETNEFRDYFLELHSLAKREQRLMEQFLNDTRNYHERIGADILNDSIHIFYERYNYSIPEKNEYYLMEYNEGVYRLLVCHNSLFMSKYLTAEEYRKHYGEAKMKLIAEYNSAEEIEHLCNNPQLSQESKVILVLRRSAYNSIKRVINKCLDQLRTRNMFVRNLDYIWEDQDRVCAYYGLEKEFECKLDDEYEDFMIAAFESVDIMDSDGLKATIKLSDLKRAFELGFENKDEICRVIRKKGSIESVLQ